MATQATFADRRELEAHDATVEQVVWVLGAAGASAYGLVVPATLDAPGSEPRIFPRTRCGACCRNLGTSTLFFELDRGDGICRNLDLNTNLCRIYETRPKICRVSDMFSAVQDQLTWTEYVTLNQQACRKLQAPAASKDGQEKLRRT